MKNGLPSLDELQGRRAQMFPTLTPAQLERFEAVYKLHTQGHKYRLGDSNLAMHSALIAAGFKEGVGHLYNPPAQMFGYFGYDNDPLLSRPAVEPRIPK